MCHKLAGYIIAWCEGEQEFDEYEHIKTVYGMEVFLESLWKLAGLLLLGCMVDNRQMFFVSIACFSLLRRFAGGRHSKSSIVCFLCMTLVGLVPVYISKRVIIPNAACVSLFIMAFLLILVYAPHMSYIVYNARERKMLALFLTIIYLLIFLLMEDQEVGNAILFGTLAETITLVRKGRKGLRKKVV